MAHALFQQCQVLLGVLFGQGQAGYDFGSAAVHLQGPDGGGQDGNIGFQSAVAALHVPEFLKTDVGGETAFGDMIIEHFQPDRSAMMED